MLYWCGHGLLGKDPDFSVVPPPVRHPAHQSPCDQQQAGEKHCQGDGPLAGKDAIIAGDAAVKNDNPAYSGNGDQDS